MTSEQLAAYAAGAPCPHVDVMAMADELTQLRGNLSLAEEGLANYALEVERLRGYWTGDKLTGGSDVCHTCHAHCVVLGDKDAEIERKNSLIDAQDAAQTSLHAENVRLRMENEQLQSRLEGSQAAAAAGEREIERLQAEMRSQHAAYQRMFDKAAELERRLNASEPCEQLRLIPSAWMRGVSQPGGPWGPPEYDWELAAGDDQPEGQGWAPLYLKHHTVTPEPLTAEQSEGAPRGAGSEDEPTPVEDLCAICEGVFIDHRYGALGHDWRPKPRAHTARTFEQLNSTGESK